MNKEFKRLRNFDCCIHSKPLFHICKTWAFIFHSVNNSILTSGRDGWFSYFNRNRYNRYGEIFE